ncbi:hypothetical protein [Occallatibacter riparius]|uniref:DUF2158 domain-containing protein n=1 Tax=Occallatibacter riparius TaxID=1002689 RepID=A0A9J7BV19_9BACT|nr:hypothetical protein [Occallatibacter riparius]UWZ86409.1 hypothetical protein MOP44_10800 [Occallatibacter riparius]
MQDGLRVGGFARLKSGGPVMEILEINGSMALCRWVDRGELQRMVLPVSGLELVLRLNEENEEGDPTT